MKKNDEHEPGIIEAKSDFKASKRSLQEIFKDLEDGARTTLLKDKILIPSVFFISKNFTDDVLEVGLYPMISVTGHPMDNKLHSFIIKEITKGLENMFRDPQAEVKRKLISVITVMEADMSVMDRKDAEDEFGRIKKDLIRPSEDPNGKNILFLCMEEDFKKKILAFEIIRGDEDVVISDKPIIDKIMGYDERSSGSSFGNFLTKGSTLN